MAYPTQDAIRTMLPYWVRMSLVFGAASSAAVQLLAEYESPKDLLDAMERGCVPNVPQNVMKTLMKCNLSQAESLVCYCEKNGIALISMEDARYPESLMMIPTPPLLLSAKGNLDLLRTVPSITIVGTRHPSDYSVQVTQTLVTELAADGLRIVSGFARGIDYAAHTAALDAGAETVAVLGCGVNVNYPKENDTLKMRMLESGKGLLLSEYLPGTQPIPANFPRRNRILSGLTQGTAVIEAAMRSGSLSTAQYALAQGKYLFCVPPHDLFDPRYAGVIPLLRDDAFGLYSHRDVIYYYLKDFPMELTFDANEVRPSESFVFAEEAAEVQKEESTTQAARSTAKGSAADDKIEKQDDVPVQSSLPLPEGEAERQIVAYLREHGQKQVNVIADALDMEMSELLSILTMLELDGFVESLFGKQYRAL